MSETFHANMIITESQRMNKEYLTMVIYESTDSVRDQDRYKQKTTTEAYCTGSEHVMNRRYRSVTVCLVLLCVLLLTAVIVLCVHINTNNQQFNIKSTEERDQLLTKYTNITEERNQLLTKYTNITKERDQLLTKYTKLTEERDQDQPTKQVYQTHRDQLLIKYTKLINKLKYVSGNDGLKGELVEFTDGWINYQSSLYFISSEKKSWTESRRYCIERGADLIIINNKEEQLFVRMVSGCNGVWIGLSDSDEEGRWKWVDGSKLISGSQCEEHQSFHSEKLDTHRLQRLERAVPESVQHHGQRDRSLARKRIQASQNRLNARLREACCKIDRIQFHAEKRDLLCRAQFALLSVDLKTETGEVFEHPI
nr:asialoglycoprotein receptor 1-like [Misgurnus anguillicaudatus]